MKAEGPQRHFSLIQGLIWAPHVLFLGSRRRWPWRPKSNKKAKATPTNWLQLPPAMHRMKDALLAHSGRISSQILKTSRVSGFPGKVHKNCTRLDSDKAASAQVEQPLKWVESWKLSQLWNLTWPQGCTVAPTLTAHCRIRCKDKETWEVAGFELDLEPLLHKLGVTKSWLIQLFSVHVG